MKYTRTFFPVLVILAASMLACCFPSDIVKNNEITVDTVYSIPYVNAGEYRIDSNIICIPGNSQNTVFAVDLDSGKELWRTNSIFPTIWGPYRRPALISGKYYVMENSGASELHITELDAMTGTLEKLIHYGSFPSEAGMQSFDSTLLIDHYDTPSSIKKVDLTTLVQQSGSSYEATVENCYEPPSDPPVKKMIYLQNRICENGFLYVIWYVLEPPADWGLKGGAACFDARTGMAVWDKRIDNRCAATLIGDDERLYIEGRDGTLALEKSTGNELWYCPHARGSSHGGTVDGDYYYLTTGAALSMPDQLQGCYGIACMDKRSGALHWSVPPKDHYGRGINPQVANGILYAPDSEGIEFYDASTGEYLGRTSEVKGDIDQIRWSAKYKDLLILDDKQKINAVKMNLVRGAGGKLEKLP
jgi:outer membrane protein assembly factor BamB